MACEHDLAEKETACVDGYCPICLVTKVDSYRIQCKAAMKAGSLGLCKRVIKHALDEDK